MNQKELADFLARFKFVKAMNGHVGVEREHFLVSSSGVPAPRSGEFLRLINDPRWTYELSACQVESRTKPKRDLSAIKMELLENANNGERVAKKLGLHLVNQEVGNANMPLDVYPDARYLEIVRTIPHERLEAACRVTGTHIHLGVRDMCQAISVYNALIPHLEEFCRMGDHSGGERLRLYKTMATKWQPTVYESAEHLFEIALQDGFAENPRNCWKLIRISIHGTIELRMFGVTDHADEISWWISKIKHITKEVWQ